MHENERKTDLKEYIFLYSKLNLTLYEIKKVIVDRCYYPAAPRTLR